MLGLKLNHVSKIGPSSQLERIMESCFNGLLLLRRDVELLEHEIANLVYSIRNQYRPIFPHAYTLPARNMEYLESTIEMHLIFRFADINGSAPTTNKYCGYKETLTCIVLDEKCSLQCPKLKIHNKMHRNILFFVILYLNISHNFQGIHHYIVNLWQYFVSSIVLYSHHANLGATDRIII